MKKRAILCTADTENLIKLSQYLFRDGWELISAGETGKMLADADIPYTEMAALTETPRTFQHYMTLYSSILTTGQQRDRSYYSNDYQEINMVCINTMPSFKKISDFVELDYSNNCIDMRCCSLIQAACRNYKNVLALTDPADYEEVMIRMKTESISSDFRLYLAGKAFNMIAACNASVGDSILLQTGTDSYLRYFTIPYKKAVDLKNGATSHQSASLYMLPEFIGSLGGFKKLQGKEISYNLYIEIDAIWKELTRFSMQLKNATAVQGNDSEGNPTVTQFTPAAGSVFTYSIKHEAPVSAALGSNAAESYKKMFNCGKRALDGAAAGFSAVVDDKAAQELVKSNLTAVVAPGFTADARVTLAAKKDMRLIAMSKPAMLSYNFRSLDGGLLIETADNILFEKWNLVTKTRPTQQQIDEMAFGQLIIMGTKQDAAVLIKDLVTTGMCCTAMVPEDACLAALDHSVKNIQAGLTNNTQNAEVLICGSALPFSTELNQLADSGIRAILQPGGTPTDKEFIKVCNERGIAMVFTGIEHPGC